MVSLDIPEEEIVSMYVALNHDLLRDRILHNATRKFYFEFGFYIGVVKMLYGRVRYLSFMSSRENKTETKAKTHRDNRSGDMCVFLH